MSSERRKTLIKYVVPAIGSSVCFFLFTIVDGIFVGHGVGTDAVGAINLVLPFVLTVGAVFMLTTIGGITITAIRLGRGDKEGANQAFMHAVFMNAIFSILLFIVGVFFTDSLCTFMGATGRFHELTTEYLFWYSLFIIPSGFSSLFQGFCRNDNSPGLVGVAVTVSTIFNIFGDWFLIFPMQIGLKGAAIATGVSQCIALAITMTHFFRKKGDLRIRLVKLKKALLGKVLVRGLPECISQLGTPVSTLCLNLVLVQKIGDIGVNAFGIINYIASFSVAIFLGTSQGLQPLFGQSYGAKNDSDLKFYFHSGLLINFFGSAIINILLLFIGGSICSLFGADEITLQYTIKSMPIYGCGFIVMAFNVIITSFLYSTKRSKQAIFINVLRSFILNTVITLGLPAIWGGDIAWFTFAIYEAIVLLVAVILLQHAEKRRLSGEQYV